MSKVALLGLSGFAPDLVERWLEDLPELNRIQSEGVWGRVQSTIPPGMPQAWTCALSGKNPGAFGLWDFTYREDFSYKEGKIIDCREKDKRVQCLYSILPLWGEKIATVGVPVTWPVPRIPGGMSISGPETPSSSEGYTWPNSLADEVKALVGDYIPDVVPPGENYLKMDREAFQERCRAMDSQRFSIVKHFMGKRQCDCVITGIQGPERMSHLFYGFSDEKHRHYSLEPQNRKVLHDYYAWIDLQIGNLRKALDDQTALLVFSDYGMQRLDGWINLNEWLIQEGYLVLEEYPSKPVPFERLKVAWSRTKAWAMGSSGRIFVNMKGREPEGIIEPDDYEGFLDEISFRLEAIPDENLNALTNQIYRGKEICSGPFADHAPDLITCFDQGRLKTNGLVGFGPGSIHTVDPDLEEDTAAESPEGYFSLTGPGIPARGQDDGASLQDIAPTVMDIMDLKIPEDMEGKNLSGKERSEEEGSTSTDEKMTFTGY